MEGLLSSSLTAAAPWVLLCFWLWYTLEAIYVGKKTKNYRPVPLSKNPVRKSGDVSIVVCTIGPVGNFVLCVERWLANNPRELIFVTIDSQMDAIQALIDEACTTLALPPAQCKKISLLSVGPCANKRAQMIKGVNAATGSIIATVDDHIMWEYTFLEYTLSCFDDPTVGGVGPMNGVYIPPERRHEAVITPWEVIIMTHQGWQVDGFPKKSVAADWVWCIAGTTALYVATILRDPEFQAAHLNDVWMGRVQNASDDIFIARWCQARNWRLLCQAMPETRILRTAHQRRDLLQKQLLRWHRSCLQTCLRSLWEVPQIYRKPYALIKSAHLPPAPI
ncbi:nucleotide-diphospho-sugar transferase [Xylariaceae sp. FL0804]|nr:nucleotide-diphospho-sugar transferase [Xylariaceae sp. FL0804]